MTVLVIDSDPDFNHGRNLIIQLLLHSEITIADAIDQNGAELANLSGSWDCIEKGIITAAG